MRFELDKIEIRAAGMTEYEYLVAEIVAQVTVEGEEGEATFAILNQDKGYFELEFYSFGSQEPSVVPLDTFRKILTRAEDWLINYVPHPQWVIPDEEEE